ncbi:uncharacterized protein FA14DRAFT_162116 [Meira miltonrushii]|uniref:Uncharacterized protein n=1 Tax=Meira miltonrushii TaxID=1280837 RepID=A0A316V9J6_9BASI|nr:uncharacterized protein FA14DRAFT_162116 [Meira miltonrushii]PWN32873.1 hypothetical protein FA14DRAFT_162116 [Meira miltonrushii]
MNNLSPYDDVDLDEQENEENRLVLSQRAHAQNINNHQMQRYEEHPALQAARIQSKLQQKLGPEYVSLRAGPMGGKVAYLEANKAIELAHEIFGHDSWSSEIVSFQEMSRERNESGRWTVCIMCTGKITIRSGAFHQDCGFGNAENMKSLPAAMEKAYKEASTDALKRCLRLFGNATGNCLYDKKHVSNVAKMKAPDPPFNPATLKRAEGLGNPSGSSTKPNTSSSTVPHVGNGRSNNGATPPQSTVISPPNAVPQKANGIVKPPTDVHGTSSVLQNKTDGGEAARQERLRQAALKREELRRKKINNGDGQPTPTAAASESLPTINSNAALPYTVQHPEGDEYSDEFGDLTSSQMNLLSKHDSSNHTLPSNESSLVHGHYDHANVKVSPSRLYNVDQQQQPAYQRGGVVGNNDDYLHQADSYGLPVKRPRNY